MHPMKRRLIAHRPRRASGRLVLGTMVGQGLDRIYVTLREPLCIPGTVLPPGKYLFRLLDGRADRSLVQIFNQDQTKVVGTFKIGQTTECV